MQGFKTFFSFGLIILFCSSCSSHRVLTWNDEFNGIGLPDTNKWTQEEGFLHNEEEQYYTRNRTENIRMEDGHLVIEARKEKFPNKDHDTKRKGYQYAYAYADYTSASIHTKNIRSFKYGRIEIRASLPQGKGVWPAVWMLGNNKDSVGYPMCGEIDIMEFTGHEPRSIYGSVHYPRDSNSAKVFSKTVVHTTKKTLSDFHTYAICWNKKKINFYFDKKIYHSFNIEDAGNNNPFHRPFYLIINFALGGTFGKDINDSILPQRMLVDYIRVYQ